MPEINPKGLGRKEEGGGGVCIINTIFVYHFVDPDLGFEIFIKKEG